MKKTLNLIIPLLVIGALAYFANKQWDQIAAIRIRSWPYVVVVGVLVVVSAFQNSYFSVYVARHLGTKVSFRASLQSTIINSLGNILLPLKSGTVASALYLKQKTGLNYAKYVIILGAGFLYSFWISSLLSIGVIWNMGQVSPSVKITLIIFFIAVCFVIFAFSLFQVRLPTFGISQVHLLNDSLAYLRSMVRDFRLNIVCLSLSLFGLLVSSLYFYSLMQALGGDIGLRDALILSVMSSILLVVNLTPGNIGVKEVVLGLLGHALGLPSVLVVASSLLERVISLGVNGLMYLLPTFKPAVNSESR